MVIDCNKTCRLEAAAANHQCSDFALSLLLLWNRPTALKFKNYKIFTLNFRFLISTSRNPDLSSIGDVFTSLFTTSVRILLNSKAIGQELPTFVKIYNFKNIRKIFLALSDKHLSPLSKDGLCQFRTSDRKAF